MRTTKLDRCYYGIYSMETLKISTLYKNGKVTSRPSPVNISAEEASIIFETMLLRIPMPPLYVVELDDCCFSVFSGKKRIEAIRMFMSYESKIRFTNMVHFPELEGVLYHEMPRPLQRRIDQYDHQFVGIRFGASKEAIEDAIKRIRSC